MLDNYDDKIGSLKISDDVIAKYTMKATLSTPGISSLSGGLTGTITKNFLGKDPTLNGIKVVASDEGFIIDIFVKVKYGVKISQVAWDVQENVKKEVEAMTESVVKAVNIHVQGVSFGEEDDEDTEEEHD